MQPRKCTTNDNIELSKIRLEAESVLDTVSLIINEKDLALKQSQFETELKSLTNKLESAVANDDISQMKNTICQIDSIMAQQGNMLKKNIISNLPKQAS